MVAVFIQYKNRNQIGCGWLRFSYRDIAPGHIIFGHLFRDLVIPTFMVVTILISIFVHFRFNTSVSKKIAISFDGQTFFSDIMKRKVA